MPASPSPSASSAILPLGQLARQSSKSSLSTQLDRENLNDVLDNIHTVASQSQSLTVFNEYTGPPPASSGPEHKGIAEDLQGSFAGFYNKLKATVGVGHDQSTAARTAPRQDGKPESSQTSSTGGRVSGRDESSVIKESQRASKLSSKATSVTSKPSVPTSPTVKSPGLEGHQTSSRSADSLVGDSSSNATHASAGVRGDGPNFDSESTTKPPTENLQSGLDNAPTRRVLSHDATDDDRERTQKEELSQSTLQRSVSPAHHTRRELAKSHERGISESSGSSRTKIHQSGPIMTQNRENEAKESPGQGHIANTSEAVHQPVVLDSHGRRLPKLATDIEIHSSGGGRAMMPPPQERSSIRLNQGLLPGFIPSRNSSPESGITENQVSKPRPGAVTVPGDTYVKYMVPPNKASTRLRSKLISKEYWMRDENARDCFHCGESFSTFRRKHHCRVCGQIFDGKCTSLVPGSQLGSTGSVRVCKPCEATIANHDDDSSGSEYSVDDVAMPTSSRPHTPVSQQTLKRSAHPDDDTASIRSMSLEQMAKTPTLSFPVRRAVNSSNRSSAVIEFDVARTLPRPSSSRSLRTAHSLGHNHRRHHSRHQHVRYFKAYHDDRAPFQRWAQDEIDLKDGLPSAFHRDSVIDPDLAQYLSDEASSDEGQSVNMNYDSEKAARTIQESDRAPLSGIMAVVRKGRSRLGERSIASLIGGGREGDDSSVQGLRTANAARLVRQRTSSVASMSRRRMTLRSAREAVQMPFSTVMDQAVPSSPAYLLPANGSRMIRSASMRGIVAPALELNKASLLHVHKLLGQLLRDAEVPKSSTWESALVPILLRATDDVDPDVQNGDDLDIRNYVKLKKIPGGKPADTSYISGLVFTKNLALKSMSRSISNPKILIITFPLEYARHEQHFMSLEPILRQEKEYLQNLVGRIAALKPDLLLAQRNISGLALQLLDQAGIAAAYNVKPSVLEAVSRCTQSRIVYSIDKLSMQPGQLGGCANFEVKTYVADGTKKTYIFLSGCITQLGCTISLRGGDRKTLAKVKRITEFMTYVVYNLKLETCLMRDEWALIPLFQDEEAVMKPAPSTDKPASTLPGFPRTQFTNTAETPIELSSAEVAQSQSEEQPPTVQRLESVDSADIPDDVPVPTFYEDMVQKHQTKILSASPFVKFKPPYLLMRARELERRVAYLKRLRDQDASDEQTAEEKAKAQKFTLIQPEMIHTTLTGASKKVKEVLHAVHDSEYDKALYNYETQKKQWEGFLSGNRNLFDPYAHQNIAVLFSQVSTATSVPCSGPDLLAFSFYNEHESSLEFEADCTLGQYVEDLCYRAPAGCPTHACDRKMDEHHRHYVHGEAQISVFLQPYPSKMRGMQNTILMWSQCKVCGTETPVIPMSNSTWKYSFGKYLELSFWSSDLHARASMCSHDLHRDHLRYFGYKDYAVRIHYDPIDLLEIVVPRLRITWKVDNDLRFRNEVYTRIEHRMTKFMSSVKLRLRSIKADALLPEKADACRVEIERLSKKANEEHTALVKQLQERYANSQYWETIPLNRVVHLTQAKVAEWDTIFADFERNFFPSEKDIRRLATLQLKKIFLDSDVSITSLGSTDEGSVTPPSGDLGETASVPIPIKPGADLEKTTNVSPEKTHDVLQSVVEEHSGSINDNEASASEPVGRFKEIPTLPEVERNIGNVQHLDLAVPEAMVTANTESSIKAPLTFQQLSPETIPSIKNVPSRLGMKILDDALPRAPIDDAEGDLSRTRSTNLPRSTPGQDETNNGNGINIPFKAASPSLLRAHSQPVGMVPVYRDRKSESTSTLAALSATEGFGSQAATPAEDLSTPVPVEKKLRDRFGLSHLKNPKFGKGQSFIPRSITGRKNSRVSSLAKHFEQLSREFEKERVRERRLQAAKNRQSRIYPLAAPKPTVEVYKDVDEAVDESIVGLDGRADLGTSDELHETPHAGEVADTVQGMVDVHVADLADRQPNASNAIVAANDTDLEGTETSRAVSEAEGDDEESDLDELSDEINLPDSPSDLLRLSNEDLDIKDLPKHEQTSLMSILRNFWAERSSSGWSPLEYPLHASDHVFADCDIIVREDEPSSVIAFALDSRDYKSMLKGIQETKEVTDNRADSGHRHPDVAVMRSLLRKTGTHLKYEFQEGPAKMTCKIFYAEQFDAVRKTCGVSDRIIESLSRCVKWDSKGGKTKSLFLKTLDDRFVLKSLSAVETQSFLKFAPNYFQIMSEAFFHELPSVIAKMLGFYQIVMKNPATGIEYNWYLILMENLFYDRTPTRTFDLKGSMRNRKIESTGERDEVLLDENMVEFIYESPLFAREHSKKLLRSSVHNDTLFLARQNVMDYSLMVAIDESRKELVVGIIDCIRTYTWDKKLESWIKDRGFAGGNRNKPTVTSPREYKKRFREAMYRYILEAPNCWHQYNVPSAKRRPLQIDPALEPKDGDKGENEVETLT